MFVGERKLKITVARLVPVVYNDGVWKRSRYRECGKEMKKILSVSLSSVSCYFLNSNSGGGLF